MQLVRCTVADQELIREMQKEAFAVLLEKYQDHDTNPANETMERITWKLQQPDSYRRNVKEKRDREKIDLIRSRLGNAK